MRLRSGWRHAVPHQNMCASYAISIHGHGQGAHTGKHKGDRSDNTQTPFTAGVVIACNPSFPCTRVCAAHDSARTADRLYAALSASSARGQAGSASGHSLPACATGLLRARFHCSVRAPRHSVRVRAPACRPPGFVPAACSHRARPDPKASLKQNRFPAVTSATTTSDHPPAAPLPFHPNRLGRHSLQQGGLTTSHIQFAADRNGVHHPRSTTTVVPL